MRYIVLDLETTGLNIEKDAITELGYALYEEGNPVPLFMRSELLGQCSPLSEEVKQVTGLTDQLLEEFGREPRTVLEEFADFVHKSKIEFFAGHNALGFDKPFLTRVLKEHNLVLPELPWLDTKIDLPLKYKTKSTALSYMAADHQFLNPFAHRALFDALTCGKLISSYPLKNLVAIINSPVITIRAVVSYDERQKASARGYYWDAARKIWAKTIRLVNLPQEKAGADFDIIQL